MFSTRPWPRDFLEKALSKNWASEIYRPHLQDALWAQQDLEGAKIRAVTESCNKIRKDKIRKEIQNRKATEAQMKNDLRNYRRQTSDLKQDLVSCPSSTQW